MRRPRVSPPAARATYTEWWWPPPPTVYRTMPGGYRSFEHVVVPEADPGPRASYVWAHGFALLGGEGGHLGLEVGAEGGGDGGARTGVFAVTGVQTVRIPYRWEVGRSYRMQVWTDGGGWWSASVQEGDGPPTLIGRIQVPSEWRRLGTTSVMWTEYRGGSLGSCADLALSSVSFSTPTADGGSVLPIRHDSRLGPGTCPGSAVETTPAGVRHVVGGSR